MEDMERDHDVKWKMNTRSRLLRMMQYEVIDVEIRMYRSMKTKQRGWREKGRTLDLDGLLITAGQRVQSDYVAWQYYTACYLITQHNNPYAIQSMKAWYESPSSMSMSGTVPWSSKHSALLFKPYDIITCSSCPYARSATTFTTYESTIA